MTTPQIEALLAPFPPERTWLLPALQRVQAERGWLAADDLAGVAAHLHVPRSEVYGVATHYPEFRLAAPGRHVVRVCAGVSCRVNGGLGLLAELERRLGIAAGHTTADGEVTLEEADCCFVCSVAPVVEVDHAYLGGPTADAVLAACRAPHAGAHAALPSGMAVTGPLAAGSGAAAPVAAPSGSTARARLEALVARARQRDTGTTRLLVATGSCGLARGAAATRDTLQDAVRRAGFAATVEDSACTGLCHAQPVVEVLTPGVPRLTVERVTPDRVPALLRLLQGAGDHSLSTTAWPHAAHPVLGGQERILAERWGAIRPGSLDDALCAGSYAALAATLDAGDPGAVATTVKTAGLLGRGGAYFPAAVKWEGCRAARGAPKYLVANGEEGEPGIFKDRHLMEADPHRLLEGMLLAAYAAGASRGILYIHGEAGLSAERCAGAVREAHAAGVLGSRVLGTDFAFEVEIRRGAGGFVLGEETALLESIEGKRAMPRPKPPFPVDVGVHGQPTVINNVETLSAVPLIVGGRPEAARTKLFGLSGHVLWPGVVEAAPPLTLRRLIDGLGGGLATGRPLGAVVIGGPSGIVVPPAFLDRPLERPALSPGTGGIVALDQQADVRDVVRTLLAFNARESCGKCTPCREGTARMLELLDGVARAGVADSLAELRELADVVQLASLCGLGQAALLSLRAALEHFPERLAGAR
ncbi:MAG TPA: NAD(P)H-dependent oxidoreductase subunit E [Vicinamibacteria bacterium]|nr:NAD(P)H-dependent oxidoreductase subunit E [Vicinamibacteria bacterium]